MKVHTQSTHTKSILITHDTQLQIALQRELHPEFYLITFSHYKCPRQIWKTYACRLIWKRYTCISTKPINMNVDFFSVLHSIQNHVLKRATFLLGICCIASILYLNEVTDYVNNVTHHFYKNIGLNTFATTDLSNPWYTK